MIILILFQILVALTHSIFMVLQLVYLEHYLYCLSGQILGTFLIYKLSNKFIHYTLILWTTSQLTAAADCAKVFFAT